MSFVDSDLLSRISEMDSKALDTLPFGAIAFDDEGRVVHYNAAESQLTGVPQATAIGSSFFEDVAPCCANPFVRDHYVRGKEEGRLDTELDYVFSYRIRPQPVRLRLYRCPKSNANWMFVQAR